MPRNWSSPFILEIDGLHGRVFQAHGTQAVPLFATHCLRLQRARERIGVVLEDGGHAGHRIKHVTTIAPLINLGEPGKVVTRYALISLYLKADATS